jgi:hypothetical protein
MFRLAPALETAHSAALTLETRGFPRVPDLSANFGMCEQSAGQRTVHPASTFTYMCVISSNAVDNWGAAM